MTASIAKGFGQVQFDPNGTSCNIIPYAFHPMYGSSSEHTRLTWTAHGYNVAFADEIGHWEYCNAVDQFGNCTVAGVNDSGGLDGDDIFCLPGSASLLINVTGCTFTDYDFDGVGYGLNWPGTLNNPSQDMALNPRPIQFSSPKFKIAGQNQYKN